MMEIMIMPWRALVSLGLALAIFVGAPFTTQATTTLQATGAVAVFDQEYAPLVRHLVDNAKSQVEVQLYQARFYGEFPDSNSNLILQSLIDAAVRGIEVRVLVDTGSWNPGNKNEHNLDFVDRMTTAGIQVWEDSPDVVSHQKVVTVDGNLSLIASTNWTFFSTDRNHEAAVLLEGPEVADYFRAKFWRHASAGSPRSNAQAITESQALELAAQPAGARGKLSLSDLKDLPRQPESVQEVIAADNRFFYPVVRDAILGAQSQIRVVQRSIRMETRAGVDALPGQPASAINAFVEMLVAAAQRGVEVKTVLDRTTGFESADNDQSALVLRKGGVTVVEDDPDQQTHAKFIVVDSDQVIVGSTNWTRPAVERGNEASVLVRSEGLTRVVMDYIERIVARGGPYTVEAPTTSVWSSLGRE
jgi:phosphatidylserine/phosphatidylglycerophosphate/cardiolipin synthase-like enzyme